MAHIEHHVPQRVPKLAVRHRSSDGTAPDGASVSTTSSNDTSDLAIMPCSTKSTDEQLSRPSTAQTTKSDVRSSKSNRISATPSHSSGGQGKENKKKGSSVFGFLSLKEPSANALEQFAELQRKQAAERGVAMSAGTLPGISTRKLPPTVPKVNTKWDGLPESAKRKEAAKDKRFSASDSIKSGSTTAWSGPFLGHVRSAVYSSQSSGSSNSSNSPASSIEFPSLMNRTASIAASSSSTSSERRGISKPLVPPLVKEDTTVKHRPLLKTPSQSSLPEISYFFPSTPTTNEDSSVLATPPDMSPLTPVEHSIPQLHPEKHIQVSPAEAYHAPLDDAGLTKWPHSADSIVIQPPGSETTKAPEAPVTTKSKKWLRGFLAGEAQPVLLKGEALDDDASSIASTILQRPESSTGPPPPIPMRLRPLSTPTSPSLDTDTAPPPIPQRIRPFLGSFPSSTMSSGPLTPESDARPDSFKGISLDSSRDSSLASTNDIRPSSAASYSRPSSAGTIMAPTERAETGPSTDTRSMHRPRDSMDMRSLASSVAPSVLSARWFQSPKERLGLGGRIKKPESLPWEEQHSHALALDALAPGQPTVWPSGEEKRKKKGLSMFRSREIV
ncbi:hypothetical protein W97_01201 [Coniosporium apollinis CBS 100218]|uniref:Uncharacterized protein n=1 Tax=Coniosporium apollinis (strain CBS 100218) TaxID=1168221 RepID=R7YJC7_CONA1|nr:uncharacterized protein W97_01201 [Coniosporium apollinis CBS 100218]EON61983.1 hypothetical protein W97_01201 [Coniosporium apollinis CBS 100218]